MKENVDAPPGGASTSIKRFGHDTALRHVDLAVDHVRVAVADEGEVGQVYAEVGDKRRRAAALSELLPAGVGGIGLGSRTGSGSGPGLSFFL